MTQALALTPAEDGYYWGTMEDGEITLALWSAEVGEWGFVGWPGGLTPEDLQRVGWTYDPVRLEPRGRLNS
jgi:hypothetical protein